MSGKLEMRLTEHPRARAQIRRAKGWAGLVGFLALWLLSMRAGVPGPEAALRGILGGVAAYLAAWFAGVAIWRQLAVAELEQVRRRREAHRAALEQRTPA